ncbi:hypothetical protein F0M16_21965 [Vibrio cholerae]|uniref:Uncharacterized protein n=1 Tax=Vibrio cholerae TaxID=666 RepID=A0A5Q6PCR8_VIBCL|nr:hypothetical protein [Vibrio cholerae]KAA1252613.1 hypothetical protein F0M16_21965 [Vibrio cholerae]
MASYLFFDASRKGFDDGKGNDVSLGEHLEYLSAYGGTPDHYDSLENATYAQMKSYVSKLPIQVYVVDELQHRVVYKSPSKENSLSPSM